MKLSLRFALDKLFVIGAAFLAVPASGDGHQDRPRCLFSG
jgi:hypothetical protein